jgi:hypothetical protein
MSDRPVDDPALRQRLSFRRGTADDGGEVLSRAAELPRRQGVVDRRARRDRGRPAPDAPRLPQQGRRGRPRRLQGAAALVEERRGPSAALESAAAVLVRSPSAGRRTPGISSSRRTRSAGSRRDPLPIIGKSSTRTPHGALKEKAPDGDCCFRLMGGVYVRDALAAEMDEREQHG